ncbi:MAG: Topoisomerase DNA binding C4 zinc finger [Candidatus Electronema aureum]|uniref:Topoisomerase DNA binding C4 zinc finger n=1 Tax=Candidatus Electronema aureum TaxID=2005002 RepID=A0A521G0B1_9BACT|nr:MAG: Topoisomerase DNA binding C4 zinc finger [Candidatus Electronema aureum]
MFADFAQFVVGLLKVFWLLLPAIAIVKLLKSRRFKGMVGELRINRAIRRHLNRKVYHTFSNLLLPTTNGTTQIDHVVVSPYGIFVIETKNMQGMISGGRQERSWTQQIGAYVNSFQNPLHQNYKHTKTFHELLGINEKYIFSLIVFAGNCCFETEMPDNVVLRDEFISFIKAQKKKLLSSAQVDAAINTIKNRKLKNSFHNRRLHVKHVQAIATEKKSKYQLCPRCGAEMIVREARKGRNAGSKFWGCAKFPLCEGTRPLY